MARVGYEMIQIRSSKSAPKIDPAMNYNDAFPYTIFDAVRRAFDESSETLTSVLARIDDNLDNKQPIFPAKGPDTLVTYGGATGMVGGIRISTRIPTDISEMSNDRIPTEKSVGNLVYTLLAGSGVEYTPGESSGDGTRNVVWDDIIGKPEIVNTLGNDENSVVSQWGLNHALSDLKIEVTDSISDQIQGYIPDPLLEHLNDQNNPHGVTPIQIGAATREEFRNHVNDSHNPHGLTPNDIGLGNVNNTADVDKPISIATQNALDAISSTLAAMTGTVGQLCFATDIRYSPSTGILTVSYSDGDVVNLHVSNSDTLVGVGIDSDSLEYVFTMASGEQTRVPCITGAITEVAESDTIKMGLEGRATKFIVKPGSITNTELKNGVNGSFIEDNTLSGTKIADSSIGSSKYGRESVSGDKIKKHCITTDHIQNAGIRPVSLQPGENNQVMLTMNGLAKWGKITSDMIAEGAIQVDMLNGHIDGSTIAEESIGSLQIAPESIEHDHIAPGAVESDSFAQSIHLPDDTTITASDMAEGDEVVNARWVRKKLADQELASGQIGARQVTGEQLFSSPIKNRVLTVVEPNADPVWGKILDGMVGENAISTETIQGGSITVEKMAANSVGQIALQDNAVTNRSILDGTIDPAKLKASESLSRVIGVRGDDVIPSYVQVTTDMIENGAIRNQNVADDSIDPSKLSHDDPGMVVVSTATGVEWNKLTGNSIKPNSVTPDRLTTSENGDCVVGVLESNTPPRFLKINSRMFADDCEIGSSQISSQAISRDHIKPGAVERSHIRSSSIGTQEIEDGTVTIEKIATPDIKGKVICVSSEVGSTPVWGVVTTEMIGEKQVTGDKIYHSEESFRVLGVDEEVGGGPMYIQIGNEHIKTNQISGDKLRTNLALRGNPTIENDPPANSYDGTIPCTRWVVDKIASKMNEYSGGAGNGTELTDLSVTSSHIQPNSIQTRHLVDGLITHEKMADNAIGTDQLLNFSVTTRKLADRSVDYTKLHENLRLPANTMMENKDQILDTPRVRNITISNALPSGGKNGDIWLQY